MSRRAPIVSLVLTALIAAAGCSSPYATQLPTEVVTWDGDTKLQRALAQLPQEEQDLLDRYSDRKAHEGAVGSGSIARGTTLYAALEDQRTWEAEQARLEADREAVEERKEAERRARLDEMRAVVAATVVEIGLEEASLSRSRLTDLFEARLKVDNLSDRDLHKVKGTLLLRDRDGTDLKSVLMVHDEEIRAGKSVTFEAQVQYSTLSEGDAALAATTLDQLTVLWEPMEIVFADGTRMALP